VKIGGMTYRVLYANEAQFERMGDDSTYLGQMVHLKGLLLLNANACPQQQEETFLHEVIHGIEKSYGLELEERDVTALSSGIYQVLKDNKLLREDK
jgi:hypothetical protein